MDDKQLSIYEFAKNVYDGKRNFYLADYYATMFPTPHKEDSERCAEVPWVASCLKEYDVKSILDIGFTFASHDYLRFMLDFGKRNELIGADIIEPKKSPRKIPGRLVE